MEANTYIGTFKKNKTFGFVVLDDRKLSEDIYIPKKCARKAKNNDKVVVKITKKAIRGKKPEGEIVEVIGNINKAGVDFLSIVKEFNLSLNFPAFLDEEIENIPTKIDEEDIKNRRDLRDKVIFTIDGEDAKDLDDAVSVEKTENNTYILNVHIADVSHYVKEGSFINNEASKRGTSVYMLNSVIPMLPKELSNGICSLNEGKDRFALSCTMEIDLNGNVISSDVYKSVIRVTRRMNYTDVYKIISDSDDIVKEKYKEYIPNFKLMEELALILKERRVKQGYLNLDIPECNIILNDYGQVINIEKYETNFAHEIIEQFMLTANETIAEKFYWLEAPIIYRVHEEPDLDKIKETNTFLFNIGKRIKVSQDCIHPKAFATVLDEVKDTEYEKVISNLILRTLKVAKYEVENKGHFGIASKYYCHFTSPIRRYPDLFVHRVVSRYLSLNYNVSEEEKEILSSKAEKYAMISSDMERNAVKAEREAESMKKAEFMEDKFGEIYDGIVSSVTSFGMFVELENTVEGLVRFENMGNDYFVYDDVRKTLTGEQTKKVYKIGDKVKVQVIEANKALKRVGFAIVEDDEDDNEDEFYLEN